MKAAINERYGPPSGIVIKDIPKPAQEEDGVLIRVHAATVNRTDCGYLRGKPFIYRFFVGLTKRKWPVLGCEYAGVVEATGKDVSEFKPGDKVFGYKDDDHGFGGLAEFTAAPEDSMIAHIPDGMSFEQAAPAAEGAHYAFNIIKAARVKPGHSVLVYGATGAIGSASTQILKAMGANVTAVGNTKNMDLVRSFGADKVIDYQTEDFTKIDDRFDFVFDAVGKTSFGATKHLLKERGIYISTELGARGQNVWLAIWGRLFGKKKVLFPIPKNQKKDILYLKGLMETGQYKPVIDRTYPLSQIVEAFDYVEKGQKTGNVVITLT